MENRPCLLFKGMIRTTCFPDSYAEDLADTSGTKLLTAY